ncbi:ATP-binding protein [Actinomycetospora cinnamomea]|uniref:AAA ATPase-like protein n=1 Tax=Actinomycetospora cinnamomea TaxID=663609 RepID=A0A2U1E9T5_9PSEU|nr:AAA family ATPase [Actinomycetospora cinnamomea]PVY96706.1 AAA ATPase-like protein [Actinomycetospora cinnamomea]
MAFVGRTRALGRLSAVLDEAAHGRARLVLVTGEAGIGKTSLVAEAVSRLGWSTGWGTCADADRRPAFWPWTAALRGLVADDPDAVADLAGADADELARLVPELGEGTHDTAPEDAGPARLRLFDAVAGFLERWARRHPSMLVLDDLQWADTSSLALLGHLARPHRPVPLVVVGCYRDDELGDAVARALGDLAGSAEPVALRGLGAEEVDALFRAVAGDAAADRWAADVHRRTAGHPFLVRQLGAALAEAPDAAPSLPVAVRGLVLRRAARLSPPCRVLVDVAAVAGGDLVPDVLGDVCGRTPAEVTALVEEGVAGGVLARHGERTVLAHDLVREAVIDALTPQRRLALHGRLADALERRVGAGAAVVPADLARHTAAAVPVEGGARAMRWARTAARADRARLAFSEAGDHLARARHAVEAAGPGGMGGELVDLLAEEADARARSGALEAARALLEDAAARARALDDAERLARVALGVQRLGSRFAMPRDAVVTTLTSARAALAGRGTALEARLVAALARELRHSVPAHRAAARPLSEEAIALARAVGDDETLADCLLARHDVLWSPGRGAERLAIVRELAEVTGHDPERRAEALLLAANAELETGSPAFRASASAYLEATDRLAQPRHGYLALTRRAALALVDGRLGDAAALIDASVRAGERIAEPDVGNVRMSQLLGLVRARGDPGELRATAAEAVRWWVGVPAHAHAVAAGLLALAGEPDDLAAARRELDTVLALGTWREDRSYLWSVFVGALATASARLADRATAADLLTEIAPLADSCGVNGALVCFVGSHAHAAGVLAACLGREGEARAWLGAALEVHRRLGARAWEAESALELALLDGDADSPHAWRAAELAAELGLRGVARRLATVGPQEPDAELRREGESWRVRWHDRSASLHHRKGLADLAALLARPGADVHVLALAGAGVNAPDTGPLLDPAARTAYRARLGELDAELEAAREVHDLAREARLDHERDRLLAELRRAAGLGGRVRSSGSGTAERARKSVSARLRDAIRCIEAVLPELGAHLDRSVVTGTTCRYDPVEPLRWRVDARGASAGSRPAAPRR